MISRKGNLLLCAGVILLCLISGCQTSDEPEKKAEAEEPGSFFDKTGGREMPEDTPVEVLAPDPASQYVVTRSQFPEYPKPEVSAFTFEESQLPFNLDEKIRKKRMFNFGEAPFNQVAALFAKELGFPYLLADEIKTKTTMRCEMELTTREVWNIFLQILARNDVYFTVNNGILTFRPIGEASQSGTLDSKHSNLDFQIFKLRYVDSKSVAAQLQPFVSKGVKIVELPSQNAVMVMDNQETVAKISQIVANLDLPSGKNWYKAIFPCAYVTPTQIASELEQILPVLGFPTVVNAKKVTPDSMQILSLDRLQLLIVSSPNAEALNEAQQWINRLDTDASTDRNQMFIYKIHNESAQNLTEALAVMFNVEGSTMTVDNASDATKMATPTIKEIASSKSNSLTGGTSGVKSDSKGSKVSATLTGMNESVFDTKIRIFADDMRRRLVIRTTPRTFTMLKALLDRLDVAPPQVLIQALVVEVGLNDSTKFGVEFSMTGESGNVGSLTKLNYKNLNPGSKDEYGGKIWLFNPKNPDQKYGYIQALSGLTNVKVISSPQVLVVSHEQANITVGNKVPLVNSEITNSQSNVVTQPEDVSTSLVRNIQYQDTGIILKIVPQVNHSGSITLHMDQTVSEAVRNSTSNIDSPEIQNRIMQTTMIIQDGQTVLCGGMIKQKVTDNLDSLPIIDQIPYLRRLVGDTDYQKESTEMLILVTCHIITRKNRLQELVTRYRQSLQVLEDFHKHKSILKDDPEKRLQ